MNKTIKKIVVILVMAVIVSTSVLAAPASNFPQGNIGVAEVTTTAQKIWGTVTGIFKILAFGAILFAGLRYMFASVDEKADIKRSLGMLVIGAVLVFSAASVVQFVVNAGNEVIK